MNNHRLSFVVLMLCMMSGCAGTRYALCVSTKEEFNPTSEEELLTELNSHLPNKISKRNFIVKKKSSGFVGWAIVNNDEQKKIVKERLKGSNSLKLLQVEKLNPAFEAVLRIKQ